MAPVFGRGRGRRCSVEVGVRRASVGAEARWCQSPRFSASLIGLRIRVCGGAVGTVNVGSRAPTGPSFIWRCARGVTATNGRRPRSGRDSDRADPEIRSRSEDPARVRSHP
jgi:hypothetical protein